MILVPSMGSELILKDGAVTDTDTSKRPILTSISGSIPITFLNHSKKMA